MAFDYHMRADLVTDTIETMTFEGPGSIWHSDQGKQFGAKQSRHLLLQKGFLLSMSRAGTPTDNGYAERFVGIFKLAVAERYRYLSSTRKTGSYNSLCVAPEGNPSGGYTGESSGRAEVLACGLFRCLNSDLLGETAPRPPGSQGSIRLVATARGFSQDKTAEA
jgi:transposase InsO family protein